MNTNFLALAEVELLIRLALVKQVSVWQPERWNVTELLPPGTPVSAEQVEQGVVQPVTLSIFQDELQGYFLNLDAVQPCIFVLLRYPDEDYSKIPRIAGVTASYDTSASWVDSNEEVQTLPMPSEMASWLADLVQSNYKPEPKKRRRPQSFVSPSKRG